MQQQHIVETVICRYITFKVFISDLFCQYFMNRETLNISGRLSYMTRTHYNCGKLLSDRTILCKLIIVDDFKLLYII